VCRSEVLFGILEEVQDGVAGQRGGRRGLGEFAGVEREDSWPMVPIQSTPSGVCRSTRTVLVTPSTRWKWSLSGGIRFSPETVPTHRVPSLVSRMDFTWFWLASAPSE